MLTTIKLSPAQNTHLTVMLNVTLHNWHLVPKYWQELNGIFRQLVGHDHENIKHFSVFANEREL